MSTRQNDGSSSAAFSQPPENHSGNWTTSPSSRLVSAPQEQPPEMWTTLPWRVERAGQGRITTDTPLHPWLLFLVSPSWKAFNIAIFLSPLFSFLFFPRPQPTFLPSVSSADAGCIFCFNEAFKALFLLSFPKPQAIGNPGGSGRNIVSIISLLNSSTCGLNLDCGSEAAMTKK
ncbi:MAG: hypothetical protein HYV53_03165 [Parcubacteria group bacterium]|nr:hypothetical protein [Parcubacteria group bacterium]